MSSLGLRDLARSVLKHVKTKGLTIINISGPVGSGKSTIANRLIEKLYGNFDIVSCRDTDSISSLERGKDYILTFDDISFSGKSPIDPDYLFTKLLALSVAFPSKDQGRASRIIAIIIAQSLDYCKIAKFNIFTGFSPYTTAKLRRLFTPSIVRYVKGVVYENRHFKRFKTALVILPERKIYYMRYQAGPSLLLTA